MRTPFLTFLRNLLIFSLVFVLIYLLFSYILPSQFFSLSLPYLFPFFIAVSLLSYHLLLKALHRRFSKFVNSFLAITGIKLFFFMLVLVIHILLFRSDAIAFSLNFFILYLGYTIFETVSLVKYSQSYRPPAPPKSE